MTALRTPAPPLPETEAALIALARAGDRGALAAVLERHRAALTRRCRGLLRDDERAAEAVQETFARAVAALPHTRPDPNLRAWLFRVASNLCVDAWRRRRLVAVERWDGSDAHLWAAGTAEGPDVEVLRAERAALVRRAVAALRPRRRQAVALRWWCGLGIAEVAARLGITVPAAKHHLWAGMTDLRAALRAAEGVAP